MFVAAERSEIILGGCCVPGEYSHGCTDCGWRLFVSTQPDDGVAVHRIGE